MDTRNRSAHLNDANEVVGAIVQAERPMLVAQAMAKRRCEQSADDRAQDAALLLLESAAKGVIPPTPGAWLGGCVRNLCRDDRRAAYRRDARHDRLGGESPIHTACVDAAKLDTPRQVEAMDGLLATLPEQDRAMLLAYKVEGQTLAQIGATWNMPPKTVFSRVQRTLVLLRRLGVARGLWRRDDCPR